MSTPKDVKFTYFFIQKSADEEDIEFLMTTRDIIFWSKVGH